MPKKKNGRSSNGDEADIVVFSVTSISTTDGRTPELIALNEDCNASSTLRSLLEMLTAEFFAVSANAVSAVPFTSTLWHESERNEKANAPAAVTPSTLFVIFFIKNPPNNFQYRMAAFARISR